VGEQPVPRKLVITSKTLNSAPQYTLRIKDWKTGVLPGLLPARPGLATVAARA